MIPIVTAATKEFMPGVSVLLQSIRLNAPSLQGEGFETVVYVDHESTASGWRNLPHFEKVEWRVLPFRNWQREFPNNPHRAPMVFASLEVLMDGGPAIFIDSDVMVLGDLPLLVPRWRDWPTHTVMAACPVQDDYGSCCPRINTGVFSIRSRFEGPTPETLQQLADWGRLRNGDQTLINRFRLQWMAACKTFYLPRHYNYNPNQAGCLGMNLTRGALHFMGRLLKPWLFQGRIDSMETPAYLRPSLAKWWAISDTCNHDHLIYPETGP